MNKLSLLEKKLLLNWSLANDDQLRDVLAEIDINLRSQITSLSECIDLFSSSTTNIAVQVASLNNQLSSFASDQFVECKVSDDPYSFVQQASPAKENICAKSEEKDYKDIVEVLRSAVAFSFNLIRSHFKRIGMEVGDFDEDDDLNLMSESIFDPYDESLTRPLPFVVGTVAWASSPCVGISDDYVEPGKHGDEIVINLPPVRRARSAVPKMTESSCLLDLDYDKSKSIHDSPSFMSKEGSLDNSGGSNDVYDFGKSLFENDVIKGAVNTSEQPSLAQSKQSIHAKSPIEATDSYAKPLNICKSIEKRTKSELSSSSSEDLFEDRDEYHGPKIERVNYLKKKFYDSKVVQEEAPALRNFLFSDQLQNELSIKITDRSLEKNGLQSSVNQIPDSTLGRLFEDIADELFEGEAKENEISKELIMCSEDGRENSVAVEAEISNDKATPLLSVSKLRAKGPSRRIPSRLLHKVPVSNSAIEQNLYNASIVEDSAEPAQHAIERNTPGTDVFANKSLFSSISEDHGSDYQSYDTVRTISNSPISPDNESIHSFSQNKNDNTMRTKRSNKDSHRNQTVTLFPDSEDEDIFSSVKKSSISRTSQPHFSSGIQEIEQPKKNHRTEKIDLFGDDSSDDLFS